ncbi:MAG: nuclear transport factor 2 family protein [Deltaproteobacteria bacterium]|nr:nuclear transport factor 2 family protein [Deltaproteobacteria bacterium]
MAAQKKRRAVKGNAKKPKARRASDVGAALAQLVRELADRRAIEDGIICYGHALDTKSYARLAECMKRDVRVKYGDAEWITGVVEAGRYCANALDPLDLSQHRLGTADVKLAGNRATSKTYLCAEHVKNGERYTVGGHYLDEWERTPAGWRIAVRQLVTTWTEGNAEVLSGVQLK